VSNRIVTTAAVVLALATGAGAQSATPKSWRLQPKPYPTLENGKAALVEGTAKPAGDRFFVENISIIQPVAVTIIAQNPEDDVKLALSKFRFDEADRTASTKGTGKATIKLRTQGEMKIVVSSEKPAKYQLAVWLGNELRPQPPPVVLNPTQMAEKNGGPSGARFVMLWAGGLGLVLVGVLAAVATRRRRK
jgi:hypothetical protein